MGHAGAIISGGNDTAEVKIAAMKAAGFDCGRNPGAFGRSGSESDCGLRLDDMLIKTGAAAPVFFTLTIACGFNIYYS
jgi:hypothetical protein